MTFLVLLLALWGAPDPREAENRDLYDRGVEHMRAREYLDAARVFTTLHERTGDPWALYNAAQAERFAGHCARARTLYAEFLRTPDLDERDRFQAEENRKRCTDKGDDGETTATQPSRTEETPLRPPPPDPATLQPTPRPLADVRPKARPWLRDPTGWALTGVGAGVLAAGLPLLLLAQKDQRDGARPRELESDYVDRMLGAGHREIAGAALIATGSSLVVGGLVRFLVLRARVHRPRSSRVKTREPPRSRARTGPNPAETYILNNVVRDM